MAGSFSTFLANELLDHQFGNQSYTPTSTIYAAALTAAPNKAGGGTEVSGGGYARKAVSSNLTNFPAAASGAKTNGANIEWDQATANWGQIVAIAFYDAPTGGNLLAFDVLDTPETINNTNTLRILAGQLSISIV
ncbi:MAG: hypothetical protein ABQ298_03810 [Puniceicoccaceae bacterium]